ncbi:hypothetical protein PTKIN_Ptkin04bG0061300 [Pterospermum kingtungense]
MHPLRDPWNEVRIRKLLEDLDALAEMISVKHCSDDDKTTRLLLLDTASVDKIVLKKPISVDIDMKIVGSVIIWVEEYWKILKGMGVEKIA